jgi:hypothetical protein
MRITSGQTLGQLEPGASSIEHPWVDTPFFLPKSVGEAPA